MADNIHCQTIFTVRSGLVIKSDGNNSSVLEQLESVGVPVESQCRSGFCGACRVKKTSGEVTYCCEPLAFVGVDEILPCCCRACGDLTLDI